MNIDFQKVADAIEKSFPEIKNLMFSAELGDKAGIIAEENKLEEEVAMKLFDEIGYVILDLKSRSSFFDSLTKIGIEKNMASIIAKEVESKIFSELDKIKNNSDKPAERNQTIQEPKEEILPQNNVGASFEQIILNQAKAMRPARPADESGRSMNYESRKEEKPINLPTENSEPKAIHNYVPGSDPYREAPE